MWVANKDFVNSSPTQLSNQLVSQELLGQISFSERQKIIDNI
jgi:hypothetical protein